MVWYRFLSQALAEALKFNTTVKNIHLSWNRIGNEGAVAWLHLVALEKKTISLEFAWYLYGICLSLQVADCTPSFWHLAVLLPSHVRDSWKILPNCWTTCPMPLMSYKSQTSIVRIVPIGSMYGILTYIYYKNQSNVGKYTIHGSHSLHHDSIFTTPFWNLPNTRLLLPCRCNSMTRWCSSRSCWLSMLRQGPEGGQGWQTISSLRIYNAMSNTKHLKPRDHESKSMWMSRSLVLMSADDLPAGRSLAFLNGHPNVCCLRPCQGARRNWFGEKKRGDPYQSSLNFWNWM